MEFIRKLKIGVSSRYAENKTAEKVKDENDKRYTWFFKTIKKRDLSRM